MNQIFREETNGQLSFLELGESITESQDPFIISFARIKIKTFQSKFKTMVEYEAKMVDSFSLLKLNHALKNEMDVFLTTFFEMYHTLTIEEQLFIQENYSSEYHKLCKLFLEYLARYVYSDGIGTRIEDSFVMQIENFIAMDQVSFRDLYYKEIIKNVVNRNKLRVNHYCIFSGKNLLKRFNAVASLEEKSLVVQDLKHDVQELIANPAFNDLFLKYDLDFVEKESAGILSMLLLYYLEQCVYSSNSLTELPKKAIEAFEMYIVYHMTSTFLLSEEQKNTLEKVKKNVSEVLASYIQKEVPRIEEHLHDFDELEKFKKSKKYRFIEETENLDILPMPITRESLRLEFEFFLNRVFMLSVPHEKEFMPIFLEDVKEERLKAMEIGLQYLYRFGYANFVCDDDFIFTLEDYIASEDDFHVTDANLCVTKCMLYDRTSRRHVESSLGKRRNLLQSPRN